MFKNVVTPTLWILGRETYRIVTLTHIKNTFTNTLQFPLCLEYRGHQEGLQEGSKVISFPLCFLFAIRSPSGLARACKSLYEGTPGALKIRRTFTKPRSHIKSDSPFFKFSTSTPFVSAPWQGYLIAELILRGVGQGAAQAFLDTLGWKDFLGNFSVFCCFRKAFLQFLVGRGCDHLPNHLTRAL